MQANFIRVSKSYGFGNEYDLYIASKFPNGSRNIFVLRETGFEQVEEGQLSQPTMFLDATKAQSLMDGLWDCGIRPSEGTGSAGAMAATQKHLDDMRRLVFDPDKKGI